MEIEWSARVVSRDNDEDAGGVRAGKRTERSYRARGKQWGEGRSWLTRHTRSGRDEARKLFGMERAESCGSLDPGWWGTELDLGGGEPLDDDHRPATARTGSQMERWIVQGCFWWGL